MGLDVNQIQGFGSDLKSSGDWGVVAGWASRR